MKRFAAILAVIMLQFGCAAPPTQQKSQISNNDPLGSWNDGPTKQRIISFVKSVSDPLSAAYIPPEQRLAVFDMDGTLLCEKPDYIEVVITRNRLKEKAAKVPSLAAKPLYKAALANDHAYIYEHVKEAILEAFANETLSDTSIYWQNFLTRKKHPALNLEYARLFFTPMIDLIKYLKTTGFSVFVVSTSQQEFIRSLSPDILPVPKQNIIGTMVGFTLSNLDADSPHSFIRQNTYFTPYNADEGKAVRLRERGLDKALLAAGNSMGDFAMLDGVSDGGKRNLILVLDHDDPEREFEYHKSELLSTAKKRNWLVISMKNDFQTVFE